MAQVTDGIRGILGLPAIYSQFQKLLGATQLRRDMVAKYICAVPGDKVLDIGCGPGDMLAMLREVDYTGIDLNEDYIAAARSTFGPHGSFCVGDARDLGRLADQEFDIILGMGLLHHLDDAAAGGVFRFASSVLRPEGRMISLDPCFSETQSSIARWLINRDRGQNVRAAEGYSALARPAFERVECHVRDDLLRVPYTHCVLVCRT